MVQPSKRNEFPSGQLLDLGKWVYGGTAGRT